MPVRSLHSRWLHFLTDDQVSQIHQAVLQVLSEVGVRIDWRPALEIYAASGCRVDFEKRIVYIPEQVLSRSLATAPKSFTLHAPQPDWDVPVTLEDVYTIAGSSALNVLDLDGQRRPATLRDLSDFTRLIDALDQCHIMHAMVIPQDIPQVGFDRILFSTILKNTRKHYYSQGQGQGSVHDQVELAAIIQGDVDAVRRAPCFSFVVCFTSPLIHTAERLQEMMECAQYNLPIWLETTNMMGATAPITIAGALVEHVANSLAGVVLMQLLNPGHPCILSVASGSLEMKHGVYVGASPEAILLHCATSQMAHFYGLPFQGGSGVDSPLPDSQAAYERVLQALPMSLAGVNFIHLAFGMIDGLLTSSYEQAVIDNEIFSAVFRLARGFDVTPETIALDSLRQVGSGGQFLSLKHTQRHLRGEHWFPDLTARLPWDEFQRTYAGKDMFQRANVRARKLLAEHHPHPLTDSQSRDLDRMAAAFQQQFIERTNK